MVPPSVDQCKLPARKLEKLCAYQGERKAFRKSLRTYLMDDPNQLVNNYRPMSLLPICAKIAERILYNSLFNLLYQNYVISPAQSVASQVALVLKSDSRIG